MKKKVDIYKEKKYYNEEEEKRGGGRSDSSIYLISFITFLVLGCPISMLDESQRLKAISGFSRKERVCVSRICRGKTKLLLVLFYCDSKKLYCKLKYIDYFLLKKNNTG
jgi:hypothetical protein